MNHTGNLLNTRKYHVKFVTKDTDEDIILSEEQKHDGTEIEEIMIDKLVTLHMRWMAEGH